MIIELQKAFGHIRYYDDDHYYIDTNTGNRLTSVTKHITKYQQPFNKEYWLKIKADQRGISTEELDIEWTNLATYGKARGTYVHLKIEHLTNNKVFKYPVPKEITEIGKQDMFLKEVVVLDKQIDSFLNKIDLIPIKNELIVGSKQLAGQLDLLCYYNDRLCIFDMKTDKEIKFNNKYQKLHSPFENLDDCNYEKYRLQLSLYKYLIESNTSIRIDDLFIVHFCPTESDFKLLKLNPIEINHL